MARDRYIKTYSNYVIKDIHQSTNIGNIYERDFMTISSLNSYAPGSVPMYDLNGFKMIVNTNVNLKKKHHYGNWVKNNSCDKSSFYWTLNCMDNTEVPHPAIEIKPNRESLLSYACYGSASKLIESTIIEIIDKYPAEAYLTDKLIEIDGLAFYIVDNPFNIVFDRIVLNDNETANQLRLFSQSIKEYVFETENGNSSDSLSWDVKITNFNEMCNNSDKVLSKVYLGEPFVNRMLTLYYCNYEGKRILLHDGTFKNARIKLRNKHKTAFFNELSDFGRVLLNKKTGYTAILETPKVTDSGNVIVKKTYTWPKSDYGNWNLDITSRAYLDYFESLLKIGDFYDELYTDNMWRSMTHEAIINFDWTHVHIDSDGDIVESRDPNSASIEAFIRVAGRQFDNLKMYIDGIKSTTSVSYNENGDKPNIFLANDLELFGWDVKTPISVLLNKRSSRQLYPNHVEGYTVEDANYEFFRRLLLNSRAILNAKGTKRSIEMMMALFGYYSVNYIENTFHEVMRNGKLHTFHWKDMNGLTDEERKEIKRYSYDITEYVYVANPDSTVWNEGAIDEVKSINKEKFTYTASNQDEYQGLPVREVSVYTGDNEKQSYLIPWYDKNKDYDTDIYFESKGGWGLKQTMISQFDESEEIVIDTTDTLKIYDETVKTIRYIETISGLLNIYNEMPQKDVVYYVYDISEMKRYDWGNITVIKDGLQNTEPLLTMSHYFILKDEDYSHILGAIRDENNRVMLMDENVKYDENNNIISYSPEYTDEYGMPLKRYGWKNISEEEISAGLTGDAKRIYYNENIIEHNTGNNPHCGFGKYDDGETYISSFKNIFKGAIENDLFMTVSDEDMPTDIGFTFDKMVDNVKCWYFSDTLNQSKMLREIYDDGEHEIDTIPSVGVGEFLRLRNNRTITDSTDLFSSSQYSNMLPYNMEENGDINDEAAANSIVNSKQLYIEFAKDMGSPESMFDFIENTVMFYAKQVIPSTTMLKYYVPLRDTKVNCYHRTYLQSAINN